MNLENFEYHEPNVARKSTDQKQMMHTEAILYSESNTVSFRWYNVETDGWYAKGTITYEDPDAWMAEWTRNTYLITSRIESLEEKAESGRASKLSRQLTYKLFANLVDWSEVYKGKQSVILDQMEACSEVRLSEKSTGGWYVPPWDFESLVTLSGFVLNGSDVLDTKNNFFITPGFKSSRFARPLKPGGRYQAYVRMMPTETANLYAGDVYILEAGDIIGICEQVLYRSWPRVMLQRFFVPPEKKPLASKSGSAAQSAPKKAPTTNGNVGHSTKEANGVKSPPNGQSTNGVPAKTMVNGTRTPPAAETPKPTVNGYHDEASKKTSNAAPVTNGDPAPIKKENELVSRALAIIADAAGVEVSDLDAEASFMDLGVDSLMSLVLAQNFRSQLGVEVRDSIFVEFFCIGDLCGWLEKC